MISNGNGRRFDYDTMAASYKKENDNPEQQFTGWWIPAEVIELWYEKKINLREMVLLAVIDSLTGPTKKDPACFASNEWLANRIGLTDVVHMKKIITRLKRLGLLRGSRKGGRRELITPWKVSLRNLRRR